MQTLLAGNAEQSASPPQGLSKGLFQKAATASEPGLPALREDLVLLPAAENRDGSPAWMVQDPVANRFFRIGWLEFEMLLRWQPSGTALLSQVRAETPLAPDEAALSSLKNFLEQNFLVRTDTAQASGRLASIAERRRRRDLRWLAHHYLFFRVPLVRPERFLKATLPYIEFIYTRTFALVIAAVAVIGLLLVIQQIDSFVGSVQSSFTLSGILAYLLALAAAKTLHELGHAYTATRYGVRVAHMGVSFVVLFPMLYTDTSESWKLTDHRKRMAIVAAGLTTEIGIAALATLGWGLCEDGTVRSALFFLAATSWVLSVGINASPFMRFDGYFLLSDWLDFPNLHARSSAFARAALRRTILGWDEPAPENLPVRQQRWFTVFAFMTWAYRLVVFLGIALVVYHYFFKLLGIVLFVLEIAWFIAMPLWSELKVWWERRRETKMSRRIQGAALLAILFLFLLIPLPHGIDAPAWVRTEDSLALHAPYAARIVQVREPGPVQAGDVLLSLESPDTRARGVSAEAAVATIWSQLQRSVSSVEDAERRGLLRSRLLQEIALSRSAQEEAGRLVLRAPFPGVLSDIDPMVQAGSWVGAQQTLGVLTDPRHWVVDAFVEQGSLRYLRLGDRAKVYVVDSFTPLPARVMAIDSARTLVLPNTMLDAAHGGPITVTKSNGRDEVRQSLYRVRLRLEEAPVSHRMQLARVVIRGEPHSLGADWMRGIFSSVIRESGF